MPYRNILILLTAGILTSFVLSKVAFHSGLTVTTPTGTVYLSYNLILPWLTLTVCSLISSYALLLKLYGLFHPS
jgi:hypothetical protein